jgi:hypothetical protein
MAALTTSRNTPERGGTAFFDPVAAGVIIYPGAIVVLDASGNAKPAVTAADLSGRGRARDYVDNSDGAAGAVSVTVERGVYRYANNGDVTRAHIGGNAYAVDDQTVAPDDGTSTRSAVGIIRDVDDAGVWVEF